MADEVMVQPSQAEELSDEFRQFTEKLVQQVSAQVDNPSQNRFNIEIPMDHERSFSYAQKCHFADSLTAYLEPKGMFLNA